jgi:methylenetetrahydrofolate dehydrogenase (NADP+) / methenyltetrahydrofolate cyclohydrolase
MILLDGKAISAQIEEEVREKIKSSEKVRKPGLSFILVGNNSASRAYIRMKKKKCEEVGIRSFDYELDERTSKAKLLKIIEECNHHREIDGILVQLPLPAHISASKVLLSLDPEKDVDGFHPINMGKLLLGNNDGFIPCTPNGIVELLLRSGVPIAGKHVVIVGRSNIVGKPLAALLMQKNERGNATVTVAHTASHNLKQLVLSGDIIVAAVGAPGLITKEMVSKGATVVDVGINRDPENPSLLIGDVDFEAVAPLCSYISPVPGGVGPMTIAMLLANTVKSYLERAY